ncbi:MAG: SMP-30/gluconolactonase/LRE family protein [Chloroflexi bacterium]|nr:SMP-30/gluconolactonase/LRE family protein [Chloroflexota bacterium]
MTSTPDTVDIEVLLQPRAAVAEGPVWDERTRRLIWVDIMNNAVHSFEPSSGQDSSVDVGQPVGAAVLRANGGLALAVRDGFALLDADFTNFRMVAQVEVDLPNNRMNDGKCDPLGRFWAGTMQFSPTSAAGALYRLDPDLRVTRVVGDIMLSNGLDWSPDQRTMYYIDSMSQGIDTFDFDPDSGEISNRQRLISIPKDVGLPDGMTVDADGYLWVALHGSGTVRRFAPDGQVDRIIRLPVSHVTCPAFGGPDYSELYITSMTYGLEERIRNEPLAGSLFRCRPGVRGKAPFRFAG